jgi:hypothetical protein
MAKRYKLKDYTLQNIDPNTGLTENINESFSNPNLNLANFKLSSYAKSPVEEVGRYFQDSSIYDEGISYDMATSPMGIAMHRHEEQPWYASLGSALNQGIVGEVVGGTLEGVGYLLDIEQWLNLLRGEEQEFGNWLSDIGKDIREWTQETTPVYTDPTKEGEFSPEDWTWWMSSVLPSTFSTLSLMIPSGAAVKGLSTLAKTAGVASNLGKTARWATKGVAQALISRPLESMMEASQVKDELMNTLPGTEIGTEEADKIYKNYGIQLNPTRFDTDGNPVYEIDNDTANIIAAKAAANTFKANLPMVIQDIPQYLLLNAPFGKATKKLTIDLAKKTGQDITPLVIEKGAAIAKDILGEGLEEGYQFIVSERARDMALARAGLAEYEDLDEAIGRYFKNGEFWTSVVAGAAGAGLMQTVGRTINNSLVRARGLESEDEARAKDIDSWGAQMKFIRELMQAAEANNNEELFSHVSKLGIADLGIKLSSVGNLGHFIDAIDNLSNASEEDLQRLGISAEEAEYMANNAPNIIKDLQSIGELYEKNVDKYDEPFAQLITREEFMKNYLNDKDIELGSAYEETFQTIPNILNLSETGRKLFENKRIIIPALKNAIEETNNFLQKKNTSDNEQLFKTRLEELNALLEEVTQETNELEQSYTEGERKNDSSYNHDSVDLTAAQSLYLKKAYNQLQLKNASEMVEKMRTTEWQQEALKKAKKAQEKNAKKVVDAAETIEEVKEVKKRAKGTDVEKAVNKAVKEKAAEQAETSNVDETPTVESTPQKEEGEVVFSSEYEGEPTTETKQTTSLDEIIKSGKPVTAEEASNMEQPTEQEEAEPTPAQEVEPTLQATPTQPTEESEEEGEVVFSSEYTPTQEEPSEEQTEPTQEETTAPSVEELQASARPRSTFAQRRYEGKPHLFSDELEGLTNELDKFVRKNSPQTITNEELNLINAFEVTTPEELDSWFDSVADSENAANLANTVRNFYSNRNSITKAKKTANQPQNSINYKKNDLDQSNKPGATDPIPSSDKNVNKGADIVVSTTEQVTGVKSPRRIKDYYIDSNGNFRESKKEETFLAVNAYNFIDRFGLDRGDYKAQSTVYFELDTNDPYSNKGIEDTGIQIVVYKDGNPDNTSTSNRKIIGLVPSTRGYYKDLYEFRKILLEDLRSKQDGKSRYVRSKYTSKIEGFHTQYIQTKEENSPLTVIREEHQKDPRFAKHGGYIIGITKTSTRGMTLEVPKANVSINGTLETEYQGQVIIITKNPFINDALLMRGFVRSLKSYESLGKKQAENGYKIRQRIIDLFRALPDNPTKNQIIELNNQIRQYLIGNVRYESGILILDDYFKVSIPEIRYDSFDQINAWLDGLIFNIDKNKINSPMPAQYDFGFGAQSGKYNELISDFLVLTMPKNRYFENTAAIISRNLVDTTDNSQVKVLKKAASNIVSNIKKSNDIKELSKDTNVTEETPVVTAEQLEVGQYVEYQGTTYIVTKFNKNGTIQLLNPLDDSEKGKVSVAAKNIKPTKFKGTIVEYRNIKYIVTSKGQIISLSSNRAMKWPENHGTRRHILSLANDAESGRVEPLASNKVDINPTSIKTTKAVPTSTKDAARPTKPVEAKPTSKVRIERKKDPFGNAGKNALLGMFRNSQNKPKTRLADSSKPYTKWNKAQELAWFKKNFPQVPITVLDNLKNIVGNGREAWGAFHNASVYIAENAASGTTYHEAFHVVFNLFLNEEQRNNILKESKLTEEELADKFSDYVAYKDLDKSLPTKVKDFFRKLWLTIKSFFTNSISGVDELFFRINTGFYKNATIDYGAFGSKVLRTKIAGWSSAYTKDIVESINMHILTQILPDIREANPELSNLSDVELLNAINNNPEYAQYGGGVYAIYNKVYNNLADLAESEFVPDDIRENILDALRYFYNEDGSPGSLILESIRALDYNNGISVKIEVVENTIEDESEETTIEGEEGSQLENWQTTYTERSRKNNASYNIKKFLRYIRLEDQINAIGLPKFVDFNELYDTLLNDLADSTDLQSMVTYLKDSLPFHPEYQQIIDEIERNPQFGAEFFNAFHNTHAKYVSILKRNNNYVLMESNRKGVVNNIISNWRNSVLAKGSVLVDKGKGNYEVNTNKAVEIKKSFDDILRKTAITDEDLIKVSNLLKELGIELDVRVLQYAKNNNYIRKILEGDKSISKIINKFAEGKNPFDEEAGLDSEMASIRTLATLAKKATPSLYESAFRNVSGKTVYSHLVPNFLSKLVAKLTDSNKLMSVIEFYAQDPLYLNNPILITLGNLESDPLELKNAFEVAIVDGIIENGSKDYASMDETDYKVFTLNSFFNNGNKDYSYYRANVLSDAPNMVLFKFKRFKEDEIVNYLLSLASAEYKRIQDVKEYKGEGYKNYSTDANGNTESGYHIMPMFNGFKGDPASKPEQAKKLIREYLDNKIEDYKKALINSGVVTLTEEGTVDFENSRLDGRISRVNFDSFLKNFYYNDYLMRASFGVLTVGDPAYYKADKGSNNKMVDYTKRAKEIYSPKYVPDVSASYTDPKTGEVIKVGDRYNTIYLKDKEAIAPSYDDIEAALNSAVKSGFITENQKKAIATMYKEVNYTDAQAYTTLPFYRKTMISLGRWTDRHQEAYKRLMEEKGTANDIALVMQPLKPFMFTHIYDDNLGRIVPVQHKNSEFLLLPQLVKNNPELKKLHDFMIENNVGTANFESAVKTGLTKVMTLDNLNADNIIEVFTEDRGIQQEVPEHFIDEENLFGTQIRKLIMADLVEGVDYVITPHGEEAISKKANDLRRMYEDIITQDLAEAFQEAYSELTTEDGDVDWSKIHNILLDEARKRGKGEQFEKAITYDPVKNRLNLPLFHPLYANTTQQLLTSIFKNRVTKQKIAGGSFVQASSYGLSRELKLVFDKDNEGNSNRLLYAEVMLPAWTKQFFKDFANPDGTIDFEDVKQAAPGLLDMVGYRIPTEDKYSMLPLKVVGFLPPESGGTIMLPAEITTIAGSDFDIDKMYVMMKAFRRTAIDRNAFRKDLKEYAKAHKEEFKDTDLSYDNINIVLDQIINDEQVLNDEDLPIYDFYVENRRKYIKYSPVKYDVNKSWSEQSKAARDNAKIDIILSVLRNQATVGRILKPGGFEHLKSLAGLMRSKTGASKEALDVYDVLSNDVMAIRNMVGKQLVGIAANHNAHHALRQHTKLSFKDQMQFDGIVASSLHNKSALTQFEVKGNKLVKVDSPNRLVTDNLSEFLAAVVDNAKDPVSDAIGYTLETADLVSTIVALGYDPATASVFVNQPIIKHIQKEMSKNPNKSENTIINEVAESVGVDLDAVQDAPNINTLEMFNAVGTSEINNDLQKRVLMAYSKYREMANAMNKLVQATKADTTPVGPTLADSEVMMDSRQDITSKAFPIEGVSDFISESEFSTNLEVAFYKYGILEPTRLVLNSLFPYYNRLFSEVKYAIKSNTKYNRLSAKQINEINNKVLTFVMSGFDFFDIEEGRKLVTKLPLALFKYIESHPDLKQNALLKRLRYEASTDRIPVDRLVFDNTGSFTAEQREDVQNAWEDLLNSTNDEYRRLGLALIKYSFFTSGLSFSPNGFSQLIPTDAFLTHVKDSKGMSLSDYLYNSMDGDLFNSEQFNSFVEQFYRNNYNNRAYVPRVNEDMSNVDTAVRDNTTGKTVGFTVNMNGKNDDFIVRINNFKRAVPYIAHEDSKGNINLYRLKQVKEGIAEYRLVSKLGIPNHVQEYNLNMNVPESMFEFNNVTIKSETNVKVEESNVKEPVQGQNVDDFLKREGITDKDIDNLPDCIGKK